MTMFPEGYSEILSRLHSDHYPILVHCHGGPRVKGSRPFRFQAAWATHPSYKHVISKAWNQEFRGVTERLKMIQRCLEVTDVLSLRIKEAELREDYNRLLLQEELFWYQKSREQWVKYGDRNAKFFHLQTLVRRNHNRVHGLYVRDGSWSTNPNILQEEALSFYKNLFGTTEEVEVDCLGDVSMPTLSTEACARLTDPVSFAEVKSASYFAFGDQSPTLRAFLPALFVVVPSFAIFILHFVVVQLPVRVALIVRDGRGLTLVFPLEGEFLHLRADGGCASVRSLWWGSSSDSDAM
nr:uncharacterized protein LOC112704912 [Arachis hypogaea]